MLKEKIVKICGQIIEYGILAIVFFIPIIFDYSLLTYNAFDLYKAVIFRVILAIMLLSFTAKIFISGKLHYRGDFKIFLLISLLLASFFISSLASLHPAQSFWGGFLRQQGFYNFFNYLLFFTLLILNIESFVKLKRVIIAVVASAFLAAAYGLIQYFNLDPFYWSESVNTGRIFSSLGQPNFFGHWLIMVLPISFYALIFLARKALFKFFIGLSLVMQLACLIFTYSRAAWLGFLGSIFFLIIFWLFHKRLKKAAYGLIGLILIGIIFSASLNIISPAKLSDYNSISLVNRLKSITDLKSGSNKMRLYYLESAVKEIKQASCLRLLIGYGPEVLSDIFMKYYQIDWGIYEAINSFPDRAHNWLFDKVLALGFLGLAINFIFYIYFIRKAAGFLLAKQKLEPEDWLLIFLLSSLIAYCINNFFSFSLFTVFVYLYLILAIAWIIINYRSEIKILNMRLTAFSKLLIWMSLFLASGVFIYTNNIKQIRAEIYYMRALNSVKSSDCKGVISNMEKAVNLGPNISHYQENYLFLMLNCFSGIEDEPVKKELRDSMLEYIKFVGDKKSYGFLHNTARAYSLFGFYFDKSYYAEADKIFNDLIMIFPYFPGIYEDLSKQKIMQEDYESAIEILKRAIKILPPTDHQYLNDEHRRQIAAIAVRLYESLGQTYFKIKNYDLALDAYKKGLSLDPYRATLYKSIADIYYVQEEIDQAIIWNKRGFMLNPGDYNWPLALSLLYRDKKDLAEAREYLNQALELAPENEDLKKYQQELKK
ncbi:O-antigen ligase family protein [Candidatus Falkowbacteria bacterium]|nr:O-antigen ligase family protein [Candidatus Falkowbacteria bacterium]